jgi:hypothetical protein
MPPPSDASFVRGALGSKGKTLGASALSAHRGLRYDVKYVAGGRERKTTRVKPRA